MCELFAFSSRRPAQLSLSFDAFARRGGVAAPHADGWGVAAFHGRDVQLIREPHAAAGSACVRYLHDHPLSCALALAHVRLATHGEVALANTQPFLRELGGRVHAFSHNGHLPGVFADRRMALGRFLPVGDTDSEQAFCALLARLAPLWQDGAPSLQARIEVVSGFARELGEHGPANFVYADGEVLLAHGHRRTQRDGAIAPPGLHVLCRRCVERPEPLDGVAIIGAVDGEQRVTLVSSVPLSEEGWRPLDEGEILVIAGGAIVGAREPIEPQPGMHVA
jgi:glutamine amidotransferase